MTGSAVGKGGAFAWRFEQALWLMPAVYAVHIGEEWFGGFPRYLVEQMGGQPMPAAIFFLNNAVFMLILVALCWWSAAAASRPAVFLLMCWASGNLFWNFAVHLGFTVTTGHYSPGLVTATLFYYPLPLIITVMALRQGRLSPAAAIGAFVIGALLMALVIWGGVYHFRLS